MKRFTEKINKNYTIKWDENVIVNAIQKLGILEDFEECLGIDILKFLELLIENKFVYFNELGMCSKGKLTGLKIKNNELLFQYNHFFYTRRIFEKEELCKNYIDELKNRKK